MIRRLLIQNFKSIANAELRFGRVNLFIGPNGAGKSNLLEAIGLYSACLGRGIDPDILSSKGVRLSAPRIFRSSFRNRATPRLIRLRGTIGPTEYAAYLQTKTDSSQLQFHTESLLEDGRLIFRRRSAVGYVTRRAANGRPTKMRVDPAPHRGLFDTHGPLVDVTPAATEELHAISRYVIFAPQTAVMRGLLPEDRPIQPLGLTGGRLPRALQEIIAQARHHTTRRRDIRDILQIIWKPGWAKLVRVGPPDLAVIPDALSAKDEVIYIVDKYMQKNRNTVSLYDASEGTLFLLFVATILAHEESPTTFALDNVDGTLNPSMVRALVEHIVAVIRGDIANTATSVRPKQVFLTSHNPPALDAIDLFEEDQRVFVVSRNEHGHTVFRRLQPPPNTTKEDWIATSEGRNTSQLWMDGWIRDALG